MSILDVALLPIQLTVDGCLRTHGSVISLQFLAVLALRAAAQRPHVAAQYTQRVQVPDI